MDILQQTAGMVVNPIMVDSFASLFNCTKYGERRLLSQSVSVLGPSLLSCAVKKDSDQTALGAGWSASPFYTWRNFASLSIPNTLGDLNLNWMHMSEGTFAHVTAVNMAVNSVIVICVSILFFFYLNRYKRYGMFVWICFMRSLPQAIIIYQFYLRVCVFYCGVSLNQWGSPMGVKHFL